MKKNLLVLSALLFFAASASAQFHLSEQAKASIVTIEPGNVVYQLFGHSLFRIQDPVNKLDIAYNFGVVPFGDPDFISNFVHGNLIYMVQKSSFHSNLSMYTYLKRSTREFTLNLTRDQVQDLYDYMEWHVRPENKDYLYLFFHDNCSTRIRDMFDHAEGAELVLQEWDRQITLRQLIAPYVKHSAWTRLWLYFMLNSIVDKKITPYESMALPDYLEHFFREARIRDDEGEKPLVLQEKPLYLNHVNQGKFKSDFWYSPLMVFSLLFIAAVFAVILKWNFRVFDFILFFITGLLGIFLLFLWFGTNHIYGHHNWNLVWAMPLHFAAAFLVFGNSGLKKKYFTANTILLVLLLPVSFIISQRLPLDALPFILTLFVRSFALSQINPGKLVQGLKNRSIHGN